MVHVEESFRVGAGGAIRRHHTHVVHDEESFMAGAGGARPWIPLRPTTRVSSLLSFKHPHVSPHVSIYLTCVR